MTALPHPQKNSTPAPPARPEIPRRSAPAGQSDTTAPERKSRHEPVREESSLFGELLLTSDIMQPQAIAIAWEGPDSPGPQFSRAPAPDAPASPARVWQQLEPALCGMVEKQPTGPVSMTLLLPVLGEVDARVSPFAAGWDISLRFAPQAMSMIAAHHERCRESLRRRMACPVRLRFEQRGGRQ